MPFWYRRYLNLSYTHLNILAGEMKSQGSLSQFFLLSLGNNTKKICDTEKETYPSRQAAKSIERRRKRKCYLKVLRDFLWVSSPCIGLALNVDLIWDFDVPFLPFDSIWRNEFPLCCQRTLWKRGKMCITFLLLSENSFILPSSFRFENEKKTLEFSFDRRVNFLSIMFGRSFVRRIQRCLCC